MEIPRCTFVEYWLKNLVILTDFNKPCKQNSLVTTPLYEKQILLGYMHTTIQSDFVCTYYLAVREKIVTMTVRFTSQKWMLPFSADECVSERRHPCNVCIIPFPDTRTMTTPQPTNTVEEQYTCNVCDKMFIRSGIILTVDRRTLTGERPYSCNVCNETFTNTVQLTVHRLTHASEKSYLCNLCNKSFTDATQLAKHRKTLHKGGNPYACGVCNKSFSQRNHLIGHQRTHMDKIPYSCDVCKKSCISKSQLVTHRRIHTGEKPYVCHVCNKPFNQKGHLKLHSKTHKSQR